MVRRNLTFSLFFLTLFASTVASGAVEVSVKSISIRSENAASPYTTLRIETDSFTDTAGEPWGFSGFTRCLPCRSGEVVGGSRNSATGIRFGRFLGNNTTRYYEILNGEIATDAQTIPFFPPRNRNFSLQGDATIVGNLIVYDQTFSGNRTTLYTATINMSGKSLLSFSRLSEPLLLPQVGYARTTVFQRVDLDFVSQ